MGIGLGMIAFLGIVPQTTGAEEEDFLKDAQVLPLRETLARALEKNLDIQIEEQEIPISRESVVIEDSVFDPEAFGQTYSNERRNPSSSSLNSGGFSISRETGGDVGVRKAFPFGLESSLSLHSARSMNNSRVDGLRPQYRNQLLLNLTQPILRDMGYDVNLTQVRLSKNQVEQAVYTYLDRAQRICETIETTYYQLAEAISIYNDRLESESLAQKLLEGNQEKFKAGLAPISEVQETETALASRRELVISARQQVELAENRLKDYLEIRSGDPLYSVPLLTEEIPLAFESYPAFDETLDLAYTNRPDLKHLRMEIENWNIRLQYYENKKWPRLDLQSTLGFNGLSGNARTASDIGGAPISISPHAGDYFDSFSHLVDGEGVEWYVGFTVSYPIGNRASAARYRMSDEQKSQALYQLKRLEGLVETEIKNGLVNVQRSWERVEVARRFEELAALTLQQEMQKFEFGTTDSFRVLDFQEDVIEARIRKEMAVADYRQGLVNLFRAMGTNLQRHDIQVKWDETME